MVAARWRRALSATPDTTVVANADDPLVVWGAQGAVRVVWVAAGQLWRQDAVGCPECTGRITFGPGADWSCGCGFRRPRPDAALRGEVLVTADGRELGIRLVLPGRCNLANAAVAAVAAGVLGVDEAAALAGMESVSDVEGRFATVTSGDVRVRLLLAKNPAGWTELLDLLEGSTDPVVIGINARVADGRDPSWLWDVPLERLAGRLVVATGERCRDLAVRLRHGGVDHVTVADDLEALRAAGSPQVQYVGNYTAFQDMRRRLAQRRPLRSWRRPRCRGRGRGRAGPPRARRECLCPSPSWGAARSRGAARPAVATPVAKPALQAGGVPGPRPRAPQPCAWWWCTPTCSAPTATGGTAECWRDGPYGGTSPWSWSTPSPTPLCPLAPTCTASGAARTARRCSRPSASGAARSARAVDGGAVVFAVCAGYQVIGRSFPGPDGRPHPGAALLDVVTVKGSGRRAVGELAAQPLRPGSAGSAPDPVVLETLTGFENHSAVTRLGAGVRPLARVLSGVGNGSGDRSEGARSGRVLGTYAHGPALARNPSLADLLLAWATGTVPAPLEDVEERALRAERLAAVGARGWRHAASGPAQSVRRMRELVKVRRS